MLGELHWYIHQDLTPDDALMTSETLAYLEACHLLFEQGLLSHERIRSLDSDVLRNISKGYEYFSGWLTSILDKGSYMFICILDYADFCHALSRPKISTHCCNTEIIPFLAK